MGAVILQELTLDCWVGVRDDLGAGDGLPDQGRQLRCVGGVAAFHTEGADKTVWRRLPAKYPVSVLKKTDATPIPLIPIKKQTRLLFAFIRVYSRMTKNRPPRSCFFNRECTRMHANGRIVSLSLVFLSLVFLSAILSHAKPRSSWRVKMGLKICAYCHIVRCETQESIHRASGGGQVHPGPTGEHSR